MAKEKPTLADKYDLSETRVLLTGAQAIVRLALMQKERDRAAGLDTAGYVTGYRGSPLATLEQAFERASGLCEANAIRFQPALNEDLAATAIWGSQQAELRGEGKHDGVFAIWYGKGPGVDRSGDALRHANHAGTAKHGGVIALMGDDHTCESSTSAHQSEVAFVDAMIPVFNPAGVQEILDLGLYAFALSRFAGVWTGLKCVKDNVESTANVDGRPDRIEIRLPDEREFAMPPGGLNIRTSDPALAKESRLHDFKVPAIRAFTRVNGLDKVIWTGGASPRLGIITAGKSYLDTRQALDELGIDEARAAELGLALYKVAVVWPLEPEGILQFARGLDTIIAVEEKRGLVESGAMEILYNQSDRPAMIGKADENGRTLFPAKGALDPLEIAVVIGERLVHITGDAGIAGRLAEVKSLIAGRPHEPEIMERLPYFCAGCPHNSSTIVPKGARAYAGIGCHYMVQWMDRATEGFTQMGGEGANWIGEAPFSHRRHVFQNIGDGTYIHSGSLAIRAAQAAGVNITFKILYNDAVAMTGGQKLDGGITVAQMAAQVLAEGVARADVVTDEPRKYGQGALPFGVGVHHRRHLDDVQRQLAATPGVTVLIYDQTCAAEKRRRRKRGHYPDPDRRVFISPDVCEGCGDCGRKSNCVAVLPLETELGRKRQIDQSACNKDFSCLEGFCPSFVTLVGATPRKRPPAAITMAEGGLPEPRRHALDRPYAVLVTGIGGTGVVTISAVLGQAAHLAGLGFGSIDVTGLAQKGGAVACHMRIARYPEDIHAIRVGTGHADLVLGGDLVVTTANKILDSVRPDHTAIVYSTFEMTTGDFARNPKLEVPGDALNEKIRSRVRGAPLFALDAHELSAALFGDSIYANMLILGSAYQLGHVPIPSDAIERAIGLNGVAVETNLAAFRAGRRAAENPSAFEAARGRKGAPADAPFELEDFVARRATDLVLYQDEDLSRRYRSLVKEMARLEQEKSPGMSGLAEAVAQSYYKLLAYKDEYEVARLLSDGRLERRIADEFSGVRRIEFHLSPPVIAPRNRVTGEPRKIVLGPWMLPILRLLAKGKGLRGTRFDPFGATAERRLERRMITDYECLVREIGERLSPETHAVCVALARLPLEVTGFGHVKRQSLRAAQEREARLLAKLRVGASMDRQVAGALG